MADVQTTAGPSTGPTSPPIAPTLRNVLHVFAAHFHVRKGNQVLLLHPSSPGPSTSSSDPSLVAADLEWKAIPNGSHAISRDWLLFEISGAAGSTTTTTTTTTTDRVGLAVFKKRDLDRLAREGQEQRGARLVAVGAIVSCPSRTSASWRACTLPHLDALARMADKLALDDPMAETASEATAQMLRAYYDSARFDPSCQATGRYSLPAAPGFKHLPISTYDADPLWRLPNVADALGPLLPTLLKRCLIPGYRLLIFSPTGGETEHAAALAMNLGEIAQAASCVGAHAAGGEEEEGGQGRGREPHASASSADAAGGGLKPSMWIRGLIGLQDISALEAEARQRDSQGGSSGQGSTPVKGWVAWTTDKLFLEKPRLFDAVLDLSPLVQEELARRQEEEEDRGQDDDDDFGGYSPSPARRINAELPLLLASTVDKQGKLRLVRQHASAREFATFRNLDQQAVLDAHRVRRRRSSNAGARGSAAVGPVNAAAGASRNGLSRTASSSSSRDNSSIIRTALTLLRYWLAGWWILPNRWRLNLQRSSFGYVPLSIRSDGGVRGSLMLLDDISGSDDEEEEEEEESEEGDEISAGAGASVPAGSSAISLRSGVEQDEDIIDGDDVDVDPILLATGAVGSLRRRRPSRSSDVGEGPPRLGEGAQLAPGSYPSSSPSGAPKPRSLRRSAGASAPSERSSMSAPSSHHLSPGSHARLADALFASWSEWLTDVLEDVEEMLYRFCPAFQASEEDEDGEDGERTPLSTPSTPSSKGVLTLKGRDLAWAGLSASNEVDVGLVKALATAYTPRPIVMDKGWAIARWFC